MAELVGHGWTLHVPPGHPTNCDELDEHRRQEKIRATFETESPKAKETWLRLDELLLNPPKKLADWLRDNDFDPVPQRDTKKHVIERRLKAAGLWLEARNWRTATRTLMLRWKYNGLNYQTISELCWRLIEENMERYRPEVESVRESTEEVATEGMEFLPSWAKWILMHPGLNVSGEVAAADAVIIARCRQYEADNPCPNQGVRNMFENYRGDAKARDGFFKDVIKFATDDIKRRNGPVVADDEAEMLEQVQSLEQALAGI